MTMLRYRTKANQARQKPMRLTSSCMCCLAGSPVTSLGPNQPPPQVKISLPDWMGPTHAPGRFLVRVLALQPGQLSFQLPCHHSHLAGFTLGLCTSEAARTWSLIPFCCCAFLFVGWGEYARRGKGGRKKAFQLRFKPALSYLSCIPRRQRAFLRHQTGHPR